MVDRQIINALRGILDPSFNKGKIIVPIPNASPVTPEQEALIAEMTQPRSPGEAPTTPELPESYVPITGEDLGLAPVLDLTTGEGSYDPVPNQLPYAPPGVTIDGPAFSIQSSGSPDWITNAQNPSPVNLPPYSNLN